MTTQFNITLVQAAGGMRFVNMIIDAISFYIVMMILVAINRVFAAVASAASSPSKPSPHWAPHAIPGTTAGRVPM